MDIRELISPRRLDTYEKVLGVKNPEKQISAYYWNKAVTASIFPALQCLEITLRNAINEAAKNNQLQCVQKANAPKEDWLYVFVEHIANKTIKSISRKNRRKWIDANGVRTKKRLWEEEQIESAKSKLLKHKKSITTDDVIAELNFGFWTNLLSDKFEDVSTQTLLWPNLTQHVFPNLPTGKTINDVGLILNRIRHFRNRFSHHEPVFKFYAENSNGEPDQTSPIYGRVASISILKKTYDDIMMVIDWISHERHNSFRNAGLSNQFYRLISDDGFYSYVDPSKILNTISYNQSKRNFRKTLRMVNNGTPTKIEKNGVVIFSFGVM